MKQTAAGRYKQLETARTQYLERARDAALLTIPTLMPPAGHGSSTKYTTPFQAMGARGVNNLAAKLLLALLPPNQPFFRLLVDDYMLERMTGRPGMRGEVEKALNKIERSVQTEVEANAVRVTGFEAFKQLVACGNVLLHLPPGGGMRAFRLDRYVVLRDPMGNVLEHITEEEVSPMVLPELAQAHVRATVKGDDKDNPEKTVKLYTWVRRSAKQWTVHQEVEGFPIPGTRGSYPLEKSPWMALRWTKIDGEDYGRGHVEEYLGDLRSLEALSKAIVEGSAAAAKILFLVKPNGQTRADACTKARNGAFITGNAEDVTTLQLEKQADLRVAQETIDRIEQRLSQAFLLASSVTRNAERVTAEEIRIMAGELEDALGGVYSVMSSEFQLPLVNRLMHQMERQRRLPTLPKGMIKPAITTGLEALGRGNDRSRMQQLLTDIAPLGPEVIAQRLNVGEYIKRMGVANGIDMDGLILGDDDIAAQSQQAQLMELIKQLGPNAITQLGGIARDQMDPANAQAPQGPGPGGGPAGAPSA